MGPQDLSVQVVAIDCLNCQLGVLCLVKGDIPAVEASATGHLCLRRHPAHGALHYLTVLTEEGAVLQHLDLGMGRSEANHMDNILLHDAYFAQITLATTALALLELLSMSPPQLFLITSFSPLLVAPVLMAVLTVVAIVVASGRRMSLVLLADLLLFFLFLCLLGHFSVVSVLRLVIVLSACRALPIHLLHDVVDAEETNLVVTRACKEGNVCVVELLHA
mmetsp:Transcript_15783/g.36295  ORF Transcript_15783/g.36295 Transcript_15783/m.36295 type:complete len:220 (+) Transcript_15783:2166-2825(+)